MATTNKLYSYEWIINPNRKSGLSHHDSLPKLQQEAENHLAFRTEVQCVEEKPAINAAFTCGAPISSN